MGDEAKFENEERCRWSWRSPKVLTFLFRLSCPFFASCQALKCGI